MKPKTRKSSSTGKNLCVKKRRQESQNNSKTPKVSISDESGATCPYCGQLEEDTSLVSFDDLVKWVEEPVMLTDPILNATALQETNSTNEAPQHKITRFDVFADCGHLVSFDSGLIEEGKNVYITGLVKPAVCENDLEVVGIPVNRLGPITEWWFSGFDGWNNVLIGLETGFAGYVLDKPSCSYLTRLDRIVDKLYISKLVIEEINKGPDMTYQELLELIRERSCGHFDEESILRHSNFVIQQIMSYDEAADEDEIPLLTTPAISDFIDFCGITDLREAKSQR